MPSLTDTAIRHALKRVELSQNSQMVRAAEARHRAALSVNCELILLYWTVGRDILFRQGAGRLGREGH